MAKAYRIDLIVNNQQAEASARKSVAALGQVDRAAEKAAATAERMAAREAAAHDKASLRAVRAADKAADAAVKASERAARQKAVIEDRLLSRENSRMVAAERAAQRGAEASGRANQKAAEAGARAAERAAARKGAIEDRFLARENSRMVASARAAERTADAGVRAKEREARQKGAIEDRMLKREHDRQVAAAKVKAATEEKSGGFKGKMVDLAAGLYVANQAVGFVQGIVTGFEAVDKAVMRSADFVTDYRESLLELAALKGGMGDTGETMKQELSFRSKTLQSQEASRAFTGAAMGVGQSSIDSPLRKGLISQAEWDKLTVMGGKFQAVEGGDAKTHGNLLGIIPQMIGRRTTAEEVFREEQQLYNIFQPGGAQFSSMASQYTKLTPLIKSGVFGRMEGAALLSAFSTINPEGAGENMQQFARATLGSVGRMRGAKMEGDTQKTGAYLSGLAKASGVDLLKAGPRGIADLIGADLGRRSATARESGESFSAFNFLKTRGWGNMEDVNMLMAYAGLEGHIGTPEVEDLKKSGKYKGTISEAFLPLAAESARPTTKAAMAPIDTALAADPVFQRRKGALAGTFSDVMAGAGPMEHYQAQMKAGYAMAQMGGGKQVGSQFATYGMGAYDELSSSTPWGAMAIQAAKSTMKEQISERGARVGMEPFEFGAGSFTMKQHAEDVWKYEQEAAARGGTPGIDLSRMESLSAQQLEESKALKRAFERGQGGGGGAAPLIDGSGSRPAAGAMR